MLMIILYAEQKKRHRFIEQSFRLCVFIFKKIKLLYPSNLHNFLIFIGGIKTTCPV